MVEAERVGAPLPLPVTARSLQQGIGAGDIRLDKAARPVNGTVHMRFRGQMHDRVRFVLIQNAGQRRCVTDIGPLEAVIGTVRHRGNIGQTGRIGQRVQIDDCMTRSDGLTNDGGTDEACASGHEQFHSYELQ